MKNLTTLWASVIAFGGLVLLFLLKLPEGTPRFIGGGVWVALVILMWVWARRAYDKKA